MGQRVPSQRIKSPDQFGDRPVAVDQIARTPGGIADGRSVDVDPEVVIQRGEDFAVMNRSRLSGLGKAVG